MRPYEATLTSIFVCGKDLGVLVGDKLNMHSHCDVTAEEEKATKLALKEAGVRLRISGCSFLFCTAPLRIGPAF